MHDKDEHESNFSLKESVIAVVKNIKQSLLE